MRYFSALCARMYRFSANSRATISSTAIFLSQQSRQYFSSPFGSETSFAPQSAHRDLATDLRGMASIYHLQYRFRNGAALSRGTPASRAQRAEPGGDGAVLRRLSRLRDRVGARSRQYLSHVGRRQPGAPSRLRAAGLVRAGARSSWTDRAIARRRGSLGGVSGTPGRDHRRETQNASRRRAVVVCKRPGRQRHPDHPSSADQRFLMAGAYMRSPYSLTIRLAQNCGATVRMASLTMASQRFETPLASRS